MDRLTAAAAPLLPGPPLPDAWPLLLAALAGAVLASLLVLLSARSRRGRTQEEARAYLAGVSYVLSDDPDAAIAELSRAAQLNTETLETYFALGALFRRKGELERAIRLHRNMLLRPGLDVATRERAQLELARDYRRTALREQAAEVLDKLLADAPAHREALLELRQLREEAGDWLAAAELQERLSALEPRGAVQAGEVRAHLLAEASLAEDDAPRAEALARSALEAAPASAHALLALGRALARAGQGAEATRALHWALDNAPELAPAAVRLLRAAAGSGPTADYLRTRRDAAEAERPTDADAYALALARLAREQGDVDGAIAQLQRLVERAPRRGEARRELGALLLSQDRSEDLRADYRFILGALGEPLLGFTCSACRQRLPDFAFRCPVCGAWDAVRAEARAEAGQDTHPVI